MADRDLAAEALCKPPCHLLPCSSPGEAARCHVKDFRSPCLLWLRHCRLSKAWGVVLRSLEGLLWSAGSPRSCQGQGLADAQSLCFLITLEPVLDQPASTPNQMAHFVSWVSAHRVFFF